MNLFRSKNDSSTNHKFSERALLLIPLVLGCFALSPASRAVTPAPDGAYAGANTAEGGNALLSLTTGINNTALGIATLLSDTTGSYNTATGAIALRNNNGNDNTADGYQALFGNTTGNANTAIGWRALLQNNADFNTAAGSRALLNNTTGFNNTAVGRAALGANTTSTDNTATGFEALFHNNPSGTQGSGANTANGSQALFSNTTGPENTAAGYAALGSNTTARDNTAIGVQALYFNNGDNNTAAGAYSLHGNKFGKNNTAVGFEVLVGNDGDNNVAVGSLAGSKPLTTTTGHNNTAVGFEALGNNTTGGSNTALGYVAGQNLTGTSTNNTALGAGAGFNLTTGNSNIDIDNLGVAGESGKIRIGTAGTHTATFVAGISGVAVTGQAVLVSSTGQLGVAASSKRFKNDIKPMDKASEAILALEPVTFHYKKELDPEAIPQFGLVAEEVEKVNPDLVARDNQGKVYTVRYDAVNAMLLNEFLKEHRKVEQLKNDFHSKIAQQQKQIEALTAGLQKVSAQVELKIPAPQTAVNNQ
jgi:hypothetical protein